jgi:hypothetical protein
MKEKIMATHQQGSIGNVRWMALGGIACCALLAGCATEDKTNATASIAVANAAVNEAVAADANRFAGGEIQSARRSLSDAGAAMNEKAYERARLLALEAEADANLAQARTSSAKAQTAADELNESTRLLRNELGRPAQ